MLPVTLILLVLAAAGLLLLRRYRAQLPAPVQALAKPGIPEFLAVRTQDAPKGSERSFDRFSADSGKDAFEKSSFLPPDLEADELEAEDLQWLLARQRAALEKEQAANLQRESAARLAEAGDQLDSLAYRLEALQRRMTDWKEALLRREALELAYEQLRNEHLDQQYGLDALRAENERLQLALAEARKEALLEYEETERLKKQLALLRSINREEQGF